MTGAAFARGGFRSHRSYVAFLGHRLSGIALALFLPLHFLLLGLALTGPAALDGALVLTESPLIKAAEWGLVVLLGLHLFFGIRILAVELLPWRDDADDRSALIGWGIAAAFVLGAVFMIGLI